MLISSEAIVWKEGRVRRRRPAGKGSGALVLRADCGCRPAACWEVGCGGGSKDEGGMPCVVRRLRISDLGRSNPRALSETLNSW